MATILTTPVIPSTTPVIPSTTPTPVVSAVPSIAVIPVVPTPTTTTTTATVTYSNFQVTQIVISPVAGHMTLIVSKTDNTGKITVDTLRMASADLTTLMATIALSTDTFSSLMSRVVTAFVNKNYGLV